MEQAQARRTLGVSLAVIASTLLFTVLPLIQVSMVLIVQARLSGLPARVSAAQDVLGEPLFSGGDLLGLAPGALLLQAGLALGFVPVAVLAWRGGRPRVRSIFMFAVLALTLIAVLQSLQAALGQPALEGGLDSGQALARQAAACSLLWQIAIPLYVLWYMNRAPARAYYRSPRS
jgi:hypothetical protein